MREKVLFLIGSFHQGGSERQCLQLAGQLCDSGRFEMKIAALDGTGMLRSEAEKLPVGTIPTFPLTSFYDRNFLVQSRRFARLLREWEIDIVHTHDFYTNIFGMTGASLARTPVRVASRRESAVRHGVQRFVERMAYRQAHAVVANCEEVRQQLIAEGVPVKKVFTIHNGLNANRVALPVDFSRASALAGLNLPTDSDYRFVTIVANLRLAVKDHPTFLRAAQQVISQVPQARFVLAGEGELGNQLHDLAMQLGLGESACFIGRCERLAELLAVSDVCVLSSTSEGFSNSILEYMAAGRPVVATDVGGAREAVVEGMTGFLVAPRDHQALANRIVELLKNPQKGHNMGVAGRRVVEEKFSMQTQLEHTLKLYDQFLVRSHAHSAQVRNTMSSEGI